MKICSSVPLRSKQISRIKKLLSWNGFPKHTRNKLAKKHQSDYESIKERSMLDENILCLCMKIPYMGAEGDKLVMNIKRKLKEHLSQEMNIRIFYTGIKSQISAVCRIKSRLNKRTTPSTKLDVLDVGKTTSVKRTVVLGKECTNRVINRNNPCSNTYKMQRI